VVGETSPSASARASATESLACRLPVVVGSQGGWLTFPSGDFQPDPKSDVHLPSGGDVPLGKSYDKAVERWVPVPRDWISPDGKRYAYPEPDPPGWQPGSGPAPAGGVHLVDIASGVDRLLKPGQPPLDGLWWVMDFEAEGVYISVLPRGPAPPQGLWLLDPATGSIRKIDDSHSWQSVSRIGAWGTADALTGHGPGPGSRLMRLDLKTGVIESWYKRNDIEFLVAGADGAGHPVLTAYKSGVNELILVTAPNAGEVMKPQPGTTVPQLSNFVHPVEDSHGIWVGDVAGTGTVSLYRAGMGLKLMTRMDTGPVGVAGGCR
jgi:hypothetical protein